MEFFPIHCIETGFCVSQRRGALLLEHAPDLALADVSYRCNLPSVGVGR